MSAIDLLTSNPIYFIASLTVLGLMVGSFLNVVIYRLPVMMERAWQADVAEYSQQALNFDPQQKFNLSTPRSRCPQCESAIRSIHNIPIVSYLLLRGQCANCRTPVSSRYPLVEAITAVLSAVVAWHFFPHIEAAVAALVFTWALIALTGIDYDTYLLPDSITLPLVWGGLVINYFGIITSLESALWGAIAGYLSLWSVYWLFKLATGKEGMGYGDFKLLAALGAWLGWEMIPLIIMASSLVGAIIGVGLIVFASREKAKPIPFGPYLAIAGWIAMIWGEKINHAYLNYTGLA